MALPTSTHGVPRRLDDDSAEVIIRATTSADFPGITDLCLRVYPETPPWNEELLRSHLQVFPEGQFVAVDSLSGRVVGMAASLVVRWDDYDMDNSWREFTDHGRFTNHDASGRTLYGAEIMVDPSCQRRGIGKRLYAARRALVQRLGLLRIRAGARLRGYSRVAHEISPLEYVDKVIKGEHEGPTLSFQLREGFKVIAVVKDYLLNDPESQGYAAVIEWLNPNV